MVPLEIKPYCPCGYVIHRSNEEITYEKFESREKASEKYLLSDTVGSYACAQKYMGLEDSMIKTMKQQKKNFPEQCGDTNE